MTDSPTDEQLVAQIAGGSESAFTELYHRLSGRIYRFALQMSGSITVAEEVTQEVFLALMTDPRGYNPRRGRPEAYLLGIARNIVLRILRRDQHYVGLAPESDRETPVTAEDPATELARRQTVEAVRQAILTLPPNYREVIILCDLEELDYAQAAEVLGCAMGTVRSRLNRARSLLLAKLKPRDRLQPRATTRPGIAIVTESAS